MRYAHLVVGRFIRFFLIFFLPPFIGVGAYFASPAAGIVAGLLVWGIAYRRHIYAKCVRCNGAGRFWDVTKSYWRACPRCGGGRVYRAGLRPDQE